MNSSLDAHQLAEYYRGTMGSDNTPLTPCQCQINNVVWDTFHEWVGSPQHTVFADKQIDRAILALRKNVSVGNDGISAEYLIYGNFEILRSHLLAIYNSIFTRTTVPSVLVTGIIIPILKKSTLDPSKVNNYRPITLGATHGKLIEFFILPADMAHPNQFGFRKGRGTVMACNYLNDLSLYCKSKGSPLYICSLDAEKCFDTIWHEGLFYKFLDILPRSYWLFLYKWYKFMECIVRWDGSSSQPFKVYRGTKQVSILSPSLFNVFINDLLIELSSCTTGVRLDRDLCNSFAYADDITIFWAYCSRLTKINWHMLSLLPKIGDLHLGPVKRCVWSLVICLVLMNQIGSWALKKYSSPILLKSLARCSRPVHLVTCMSTNVSACHVWSNISGLLLPRTIHWRQSSFI